VLAVFQVFLVLSGALVERLLTQSSSILGSFFPCCRFFVFLFLPSCLLCFSGDAALPLVLW
jgi:hypothetical protein